MLSLINISNLMVNFKNGILIHRKKASLFYSSIVGLDGLCFRDEEPTIRSLPSAGGACCYKTKQLDLLRSLKFKFRGMCKFTEGVATKDTTEPT
jgi:hypothetical protein